MSMTKEGASDGPQFVAPASKSRPLLRPSESLPTSSEFWSKREVFSVLTNENVPCRNQSRHAHHYCVQTAPHPVEDPRTVQVSVIVITYQIHMLETVIPWVATHWPYHLLSSKTNLYLCSKGQTKHSSRKKRNILQEFPSKEPSIMFSSPFKSPSNYMTPRGF